MEISRGGKERGWLVGHGLGREREAVGRAVLLARDVRRPAQRPDDADDQRVVNGRLACIHCHDQYQGPVHGERPRVDDDPVDAIHGLPGRDGRGRERVRVDPVRAGVEPDCVQLEREAVQPGHLADPFVQSCDEDHFADWLVRSRGDGPGGRAVHPFHPVDGESAVGLDHGSALVRERGADRGGGQVGRGHKVRRAGQVGDDHQVRRRLGLVRVAADEESEESEGGGGAHGGAPWLFVPGKGDSCAGCISYLNKKVNSRGVL